MNPEEIVQSYSISNGRNEHIPRKLFIPKKVVYRNGVDVAHKLDDRAVSSTSPSKSSLLDFNCILELSDCLGKGFPFITRILEDGKLAGLFVDEEQRELTLRTFSWNNDQVELDGSWSVMINPYDGDNGGDDVTSYLPLQSTISVDCSYCVMVKHFRHKAKRKNRNKYCISVARMKPPLENGTVGGVELYKDVFTIEFQEDVRYFLLCLSPNKNLLAVTSHFNLDKSCCTHIVQLAYSEQSNSYTGTLVNKINLHDNVRAVMFGEFDEKLIFLGRRRFFIVENSSPPNYEVFTGHSAALMYDGAAKADYLSLRRSDTLELLKITGNRKLFSDEFNAHGMGKVTFEISKTWSVKEVLQSSYGHLKAFYVNNCLDRIRWFLGFLQFILVVDPFTFQCLYRLNLGLKDNPVAHPIDSPFNDYTFEVDWSGKQIILSCLKQGDFVGLKVYHIESPLDLSLKHQAALVVMETFSMDALRKMNLPKHIRQLLGDHKLR